MFSFKRTDSCYLWGIKGLVFLIPFVPLLVTPSMVYPYISGKSFAFRILIEFAAALWLGLIAINREYRPRNSALTLSILIFTFIVGLANLTGVSPYNSFWSGYERMEGYITILHLVLYFVIVKSVLRSRRDWTIFFNLFIAVSGLVSVYALIMPLEAPNSSQFAMIYGTRIYGTIGNPPFLASYLLVSCFFGVLLVLNTERLYLKLGYLLLIVINAIAIYFSASRGAILAGFIGITIFGLYYILKKTTVSREKLIKRVALSVLCVFIVLSGIVLTLRNAEFVKHDQTLSRFANMFSDESVLSRFGAWKFAWNGFKERPILGWGQENFIGVYTVNPIPFVEEFVWLDHAHNIIIDWLINAGVLGLFSYLSILGIAFYMLWTAYREKTVSQKEAVTIATALIVYFIQNLFTFDTVSTYLLFFTLLAYIDNSALKKAPALKETVEAGKINTKASFVILPALLIFSFTFYYLNYKPAKESLLTIEARTSAEDDDTFIEFIDDVDSILSLKTFGDDYVREGLRSISDGIIANKFYTQPGALQFIQKTLKEVEKEIEANWFNLKRLTAIIFFYTKIAEYEPSYIAKTEELVKNCIRLNPEYQWLYMALADVYVLKKDYEQAFINVKKIVDWDPQNNKKQFKLALAAIYTYRDNVVKGALEDVKKIREADNAEIAAGRETVFSAAELYQLARLYRETNKFHEALKYYKELIDIGAYQYKRDFHFHNPTALATLHLETAKIYLEIGDRESAIKEAQKAVKLDPENFAEKAKDIINQAN